jgi:hypothetical protein
VKDVDKAREIVQKTAGYVGLEQSTLDTTLKLLDEYDKARENVFKELVELTTKSDVSDLLSEWKDLCDDGRNELRKLNDISPGNGIGVVMVGLSKFQSGEFKIWDQNAKSEIARAVVDIKLIYLANLKLVQACNQELQDFASQKKDLIERAEGPFGATKDVLIKTASLLHAAVKAKGAGAPSVTDPVQGMVQILKENFTAVSEAAKKKRALVEVLLARLAMIKDAQSKLDLKAIDDAYRAGESAANSLQGVGKDSPYEAEDWNDFAKECIEKLKDAKELAEDQSKAVFDLLVNRLKEETAKSIEALTDDPAEQERWNDALVQSFDSIQNAVEQEQTFLDSIVQGPMRQALAADWNLVQVWAKQSLDELKSTLESIRKTLKGS